MDIKFRVNPYNLNNKLIQVNDIINIMQTLNINDFKVNDLSIYQTAMVHKSYCELSEYKESLLLLVKLLGKNIGVTLEDIDIKLILDIYLSLNEDIIANTRYNTMNITNTDEHPLVKDINKKYKDKIKLKKENIKNFQFYLKNTNKVLSLTSILIIVIQTSIPKYNIKNNVI